MSFDIDGKCLCYHGPLLYEARILRIYNPETKTYQDKQNGQVALREEDNFPQDCSDKHMWFIHYQGWKATWDEWVGEERIRPYNEENLALKKQLVRDVKEAAANAKRAKSKGGSVTSSGSTAVGGKREKSPSVRGRSAQSQAHQNQTQHSPHSQQPQQQASQQPQSNHPSQAPKITVRMPLVLRSLLVDDWEYITKERKLLQLPCSPNVQEILDAYYKYRASQLGSPVAQTLLHEFVEGIRLYFDQCLSHLLLYRLERLQFDEVCASSMPQGSEGSLTQTEPLPSAVYGGTHLIRLISLMPELIVGTTMDEKNCHTVVSQCEALLAWISTRIGLVIPNKYVNTSAQYEGIALGM